MTRMSQRDRKALKLAIAALDDVELESTISAACRHDFEVVQGRIEIGEGRQRTGRSNGAAATWRNTDWLFGRKIKF